MSDQLERIARAVSEAGGAVDWEHALEVARAALDASGNDERDRALRLIANMERIGPVSDIVAWKHLADACQAVARRAIAKGHRHD